MVNSNNIHSVDNFFIECRLQNQRRKVAGCYLVCFFEKVATGRFNCQPSLKKTKGCYGCWLLPLLPTRAI